MTIAAVLAVLVPGPVAGAAPPGGALAATEADAAALRIGAVPGEAIVRFETGAGPAARTAARAAAGADHVRSLASPRTQLVEVAGSVTAAVRRLERQPGVAYAQPNYRYEALATAPNDPRFGDLWGLGPGPGIGVLGAWDTSTGAGQVIAVLDTGIALDPPHPDLAPNLWTGPGGSHGYDFIDDDPVPDDFHYHGTHVAGTAAAAAGNGLGIAGVAPDARIMAVRVLDGNGSGSTATIAEGIEWAAEHGADVINLSLGGSADGDQALEDAIAVAHAHDVIVVAAAGNEAKNNDSEPTVPCALPNPNLICVAAVTAGGAFASYSNRGATTVDVGAPGSGIVSADVDYGSVPDTTDDFSEVAGWGTNGLNGGRLWSQVATPNSDGNAAVTDSAPGTYGRSQDGTHFAESWLLRTASLSLAGRRGCHMAFQARYEIELGYDLLLVGATPLDLQRDLVLTGSTNGVFRPQRASIAHRDGDSAVLPSFVLLSDGTVELDGAYIDAFAVRCRAAPAPAGAYQTLNGTSMATPHVAGIAALVRAAAPAASAVQVRQAIEQGGVPVASLAGRTVTGRRADAGGAIAAALGQGSQAEGPGLAPPSAPVSPVSPVAPANARGGSSPRLVLSSGREVRVSRRGRLVYAFRASPGVRGRIVLRTRRKVRVGSGRRVKAYILRRSFHAGRDGKVRVRALLDRRALGVLRRQRRVEVTVRIEARDLSGARARAAGRLTLIAP